MDLLTQNMTFCQAFTAASIAALVTSILLAYNRLWTVIIVVLCLLGLLACKGGWHSSVEEAVGSGCGVFFAGVAQAAGRLIWWRERTNAET